MDLKLKDKVAIITGTGSQRGYGQGIAKFMAKEGATIFGVDFYDWEGCQKTGKDIIAAGGKAAAFKAFLETPEEEWIKDMNDNLYAHMMMVKAVAPHMIERKYGRIVCYSGGQGLPNNAMYGASKAGVVAFAHSIAKELAPHGVIVNLMGPGVGNTGLGGGMEKLPKGFMEGIAARSALKRLCTPDDMAPVVAFLASDTCSYMVGGIIQLGA